MKIDSSMLTAYVSGRQQRAAGDEDGEYDQRQRGIAQIHMPSVAPSMPLPSGFANALWEARVGTVSESAAGDPLVAEFMELAKMSPAERLRKDMLEALGLDEESLAALPAEERKAIEEDIRRAIKEQLGIEENAAELGGNAPETLWT